MEEVNPRDIIGVELFLINHGITKKKPKIQLLTKYASHIDFKLIGGDILEQMAYLCQEIQKDFKAFRNWFKENY